jgi:two-component system NtrC family sensor kinase
MRNSEPAAVRQLYVVLAAVILLPLLLFIWSAWNSYRQHFSEATDRLRNTVEIASEHVTHVLNTHQLIIEQINQLVAGLSDEQIRGEEGQLHERLRFLADSYNQVSAIFVFDADCRGLVSSAAYPLSVGADCAGRDYFRVHREGLLSADANYVSELIRGRVTDRTVIIISRRRGEGKESEPFSGITAVSIDPQYFQKVYFSRIAAMGFTTVVLSREDGSLLARFPRLPDELTKLPPNSSMMETISRAPERGIFRSFSPVDNLWRQVAYRRLEGYPIYLSVGLDESAILAAWRTALIGDIVFGVPATAALILLTILALRRTRREGMALQELQEETGRRREAEEQLRHKQKMEAIGQLTGGIAHDFNNLLMVVDGSLARLRREPTGDKAARSFDMIKTAIDRGASLTRQLLSFSQLRTIQPSVIDVCQLVAQMKDMLERALRGDIELRFDLDEAECPAFVDRGELDLAILNIAVNARDAMPKGGSFTISVGPVHLRGEQEAGGLRGEFVSVRLADTGSGIDPEHLPRVFEPYFTTKQMDRGTGLGLSQVYGFAKQAGGHASVASAPSRGTTITIYLPRARDAVPAQSGEEPRAPTHSESSKSVLLVEDNFDVAEVLAGMLEELGHKVERVAGAAEALERLKSKPDFDHVVSDILMPGGIGGLELAEAIRELYPSVPVLLITGYSAKAREGLKDGFEVLKKPFSLPELATALRRGPNQAEAPVA